MASSCWSSELELIGDCYEGIVDNLDVLDRHRVETVTSYGTRKSRGSSAGKVCQSVLFVPKA